MSGQTVPPNLNFGQNKIRSVITALRDRCSWPHFREALKKARLPIGLGWAELEGAADDKYGNGPKLRQLLQGYYSEHIVAGERFVQIYDLPQIDKIKLLATLSSAVISHSEFQATYPLPLPSKLLLAAPSTPTLVEVRALDHNDYALVYCSVRSYDDRVKYAYSQLPTHVQQTYTEIDQLITVRKVYYQAYDVAIVRPGLGRIEICVDRPKKVNADYISSVVLNIFGALCGNLSILGKAFGTQPYNIFPAIAGIYFTANEGTVRSLSFRTLTGSRKHEKMIKSDDDLRAEKFHQAGAQAVQNKLKPYELTVDWDIKVPNGKVEVAMKALIKEVSSPDPRLEGFYVDAESNSLMVVGINKVVKYL